MLSLYGLILHMLKIFTELRCQIKETLSDRDVYQYFTTTLSVVISKPKEKDVEWLRKGTLLPTELLDPQDLKFVRFTMSADDKGLRHTLTISGVLPEDEGKYTVAIRDRWLGTVKSCCNLTVNHGT